MEKNEASPSTAQAAVADWMSAVKNLWENLSNQGADATRNCGMPGKSQQEKLQKSWETGAKMFQAMTGYLGKPETIEGVFKGLDTAPDLMTGMIRQSWEGYFDLQRQWMERAAKVGQNTKAYSFDDIDQETFKSIRELYEKEFRKFLQIPQLGLNRFHQEKLTRLMDAQTIFQTTLGEFLYMFYVPLEKTTGVMQEKLEAMAEAGELHDDAKAYYNMWIKILEGHYMTILQSPEYAQVMDNTIAAFTDYKAAKDDVLCDMLQPLPVPTNQEMDALYKDVHAMKKKLRELSREIKRRAAKEEND
jgi:class III poly(R)-hydroxyalkanoic acid synthase PhaE subunit